MAKTRITYFSGKNNTIKIAPEKRVTVTTSSIVSLQVGIMNEIDKNDKIRMQSSMNAQSKYCGRSEPTFGKGKLLQKVR